jgi:hypothetical protein
MITVYAAKFAGATGTALTATDVPTIALDGPGVYAYVCVCVHVYVYCVYRENVRAMYTCMYACVCMRMPAHKLCVRVHVCVCTCVHILD